MDNYKKYCEWYDNKEKSTLYIPDDEFFYDLNVHAFNTFIKKYGKLKIECIIGLHKEYTIDEIIENMSKYNLVVLSTEDEWIPGDYFNDVKIQGTLSNVIDYLYNNIRETVDLNKLFFGIKSKKII